MTRFILSVLLFTLSFRLVAECGGLGQDFCFIKIYLQDEAKKEKGEEKGSHDHEDKLHQYCSANNLLFPLFNKSSITVSHQLPGMWFVDKPFTPPDRI